MVQERIDLIGLGEAEAGAGGLVDDRAGCREPVARFAHGVGDLTRHRRERFLRPDRDAQAPGVGMAGSGQGRAGDCRIARAGEHGKDEVEILRMAGDRAGDDEVCVAGRAPLRRRRDQPPG